MKQAVGMTYTLGVATRGYRLRIAASAAAGVVRVAAGLLFILLSKRLVDIATGHAQGELPVYVISLIAIAILETICSTLGSRWTELTEAAVRNSLRSRIFGRLLHSRWQGREAFHTGDLLARLTEDVRSVAESLCRTLPTAIVSMVQLAAAFVFLWVFSPSLALTLLLLLPLFPLAGKVFFRRIRRYTSRIRRTESRIQETMQESLQHRVLLLTMQQTARALETVDGLQQSLYKRIRCRTNFTNYSRSAVMAGFEAGYLAAFLWGIAGLRDGTVTFGLMTAYLQLAGQIQRPVSDLAQQLPALVQAHTAMSRLSELERLSAEDANEAASNKEVAGNNKIENGDGFIYWGNEAFPAPFGIHFSHVTFTYPGKEIPQLADFTHYFAPGSKTAVMGETGAGKSTLLRLILGLLTPQAGEIHLAYADSCLPVSASTRRHLVYVQQGNTLLSGTIRQNLLLGNPHATDEQLRSVLHTAAAEFVFGLKNGLDTRCGEHGEGLSEGQAQRIAIARGLLRPGAILLLDEISASLDEETETMLMRRLMEAYPDRTLLLVTHRRRVAAYCDEILFINNNSINHLNN